MMTRQYFGTDGIRGTVGQAPMTPDFILRLGQAAGNVLKKHNPDQKVTVLIGKDTRVSGYLLESCLEAGFISVGVDVVLVGPMPTAGVAYLARTLSMTAGVVISASHNPFQDNGIKFFSAQGAKLPDSWELQVESELGYLVSHENACSQSNQLGKAKRLSDASGRYIEFCKGTFPSDKDLRGLKVVVDCANGAAYQIAPAVFRELGAEVIELANQPDGLNINAGVGATHPDVIAKAVTSNKADYGFALDGDADRLICVDGSGRIFNGDELLYALAVDRANSGLPIPGVVGTQMSNLGLELAFDKLNIDFVRAKVGDRYVYEQLRQRNWHLGGESSGHLLVLDQHTTGDGIISALQVLRAVRNLKQSLAEILEPLQMMPQVLQNARMPKGYDWQGDNALQKACQIVRQSLGEQGRLLIRPSGTEPVLRIMIEASDKKQAAIKVNELVSLVEYKKTA